LVSESSRWGTVRLVLVVVAVFGLVLAASSLYMPEKLFLNGIFSLRGVQYWIMPLAAMLAAFLLASNYLSMLYRLPRSRLGLRRLVSILFALRLPYLRVENGQRDLQPDEINLLDYAGGPGMLHILPGSAALVEDQSGPSSVYGSGYYFISRRETLKNTASLEDQHGLISTTKATTRDGIEVVIRDISYRYRLLPGRRSGEPGERTPQNPFPFSVRSVNSLTYNRTAFADGSLTPIATAINITISGVVVRYINRCQFDQLTSPAQQAEDPRTAIKNRLFAEANRDALRRLGVELLWVDIGHFDVANPRIWEERIGAWQAKWIGDARVRAAHSEARRLMYQELGRAEGQAAMLVSLIAALEDARLSGDQQENVRKLMLFRTAQLLDAMRESSSWQTTQRQLPDAGNDLGRRGSNGE
jgi:hypothetical protein